MIAERNTFMTNRVPVPVMKIYDAITNVFIRISKKSKILSLTDIEFLYGMASYKYYANCLLHSQKPCYQQFRAVEKDQYGRTWHLYGPEHSKRTGDDLFVWVASAKQYDTAKIADYPPGYVYQCFPHEAPAALSGMPTVLKVRVD